MKKFISTILAMTVFFIFSVAPVFATEQPIKAEYKEAKCFIANIDFNYFLSCEDLGDDVIRDLENIQKYTATHKNYTMADLNKLIEPAGGAKGAKLQVKYDYDLLPTSKVDLNSEEQKVFNSNPAYGLTVLMQGQYANNAESGRFGSNTKGTNGDAFRHALWNALGTHYTSKSYMKKFATAHETGAYGYDPDDIDVKMDLKNNEKGRSLLGSIKLPSHPVNGAIIPNLISDGIAEATKKGELARYIIKGYEPFKRLIATDSDTHN